MKSKKQWKKMLATVIGAVLMVGSLWIPGDMSFVMAADWGSDYDTRDTFEIGSLEELQTFAKMVNEGSSFEGKTVTLTSSIDLSSVNSWTPIGTKEHPFKGTFDGGNYTVSNLTINNPDLDYAGLFGNLNSPGVIKNVVIENAAITAQAWVGALAGAGYTGAIDNCIVKGAIAITGNYMVGGLTGYGYAKITNCSVTGSSGSTIKGIYKAEDLEGDSVGGLVGFRGEGPSIVTESCHVSGVALEGTRKIGGLMGSAFNNSTITGCTVSDVSAASNATPEYAEQKKTSMGVGGLIGIVPINGETAGTLTNCSVENVTLDCPVEIASLVHMGYITGGIQGSTEEFTAPTEEQMTVADVQVSGSNSMAENTKELTGGNPAAVNGSVTFAIGDKKYDTLEAAMEEAAPGDTITLLRDAEIGSTIIRTAVNLDLAGHTLSIAADASGFYGLAVLADMTIKNGSITDLRTNTYSTDKIGNRTIQVQDCNFTTEKLTLNFYRSEIVEGTAYNYGIYILDVEENESHPNVTLGSGTEIKELAIPNCTYTNEGYGVGVVVRGSADVDGENGAVLVLDGASVETTGFAVSGNGTAHGTNITVKADSLLKSEKSTAIYHPQKGVLNIEGGTIEGLNAGIEIRAGELNMSGGTVRGNSAPTDVEPNGNGTTSQGAGIAVSQHTTKLPITVNITGGTVEGYSAFYESNPQKNGKEDLEKIALTISGGEFNTLNGGNAPIYSEDFTGFISGGTFSEKISEEYCSDGYEAVLVPNAEGKYVVVSEKGIDKAGEVSKLIEALPGAGDVTLSAADAIDAAKAAYESLTDAEKALVSDANKAKLDEVVNALAALRDPEDSDDSKDPEDPKDQEDPENPDKSDESDEPDKDKDQDIQKPTPGKDDNSGAGSGSSNKSTDNSKSSATVKTGDSANAVFWGVAALAAAVVAAGAVMVSRRRRHNR